MQQLMWKKFGQWVLVNVLDTKPEMVLVQEENYIPKWVDVRMTLLPENYERTKEALDKAAKSS